MTNTMLDKRRQGDEWRSKTLRSIRKHGGQQETAAHLLSLIPEEWGEHFAGFDLDAKLLKCRVAACFRVSKRSEALDLMDKLAPIPLVHVKYEYEMFREERGIWPVTYENPKLRVKERFDIAPFLLTVAQGLNFGPIVSVQWVTRADERRLAVVNVEVSNDPAAFIQEREGIRKAGYTGAFKYKWVRNEWFPPGWETGWFGRWSDDPSENAHCTMFWPTSKFRLREGVPTHIGAGDLLEVERVEALLERNGKGGPQ